MKSSSSFTVEIIKSLNPSEKAYVKKQISSGNKHLIQLFNDLNKCDNYQKSTFVKKNRHKGYITNLSQNKNYLGRKIIDALINYRAKSFIEIEIYNLINEIHILIDKKFYKRAKKLIDRALEKVELVENYNIGYTLIGILLRILNDRVQFALSKDEIKIYKNKRRFFLKQMNLLDQFDELHVIYIENVDSKMLLKAYQEKLKHLNLSDKKDLPAGYPLQAKRIFYFAKAKISELLNQPEDCVYFSEKAFKIYEKNEHLLKHNYLLFLRDSVNYLNNLLIKGDYSKLLIEQKRINVLSKKHNNDFLYVNNNILGVINYLMPQIAYNYGKYFDKALEFSNKYLSFLMSSNGHLSDHFEAVSSIHITYANLYNRHYTKALECIEPALKHKNYSNQYVARILKILAHYYLGDDLVLDHLFRSFFNYLKTADKKEQIANIRKLKKHINTKTIYQLKNEDFEEFVYIHWEELE